jgi:hypothetical protein
MNQFAKRTARRGCFTPRGATHSRGSRVGTKLRDCHQSKQLTSSANFKPLTSTFAPPAGLERAPYGLEVDPRPSMPYRRVPSSLVTSSGPSS